MAPNICHDLGAGQDLDVELLFELVAFLEVVSMDHRCW